MSLRPHVVAAVLLALPTSAHAEPASPPSVEAPAPEKNLAEARRHFGLGVQLYRDRDFRGALGEFNRAYSLGPSPRILYDIGQTELELQDLPAALKTFARYLKDSGSDLTPSKRDEVEAIMTRSRARVAELTVHVAGPPAEVGEVAGEDRSSVELSLVVPAVVPVPIASRRTPLVLAPPPDRSPSRAPIWISLGVTGGLGVATLTTAILSLSAKRHLDAELDTFPTNEARVQSARSGLATTSLVTDVLGGLTLVGVAVTTYLALTLKSPSAVSGSVKVGLGVGSVLAQGQF